MTMFKQFYWTTQRMLLTVTAVLSLFSMDVRAYKIEDQKKDRLDASALIHEKQRLDCNPSKQDKSEYHLEIWNHRVIFNNSSTSIYITQEKP